MKHSAPGRTWDILFCIENVVIIHYLYEKYLVIISSAYVYIVNLLEKLLNKDKKKEKL